MAGKKFKNRFSVGGFSPGGHQGCPGGFSGATAKVRCLLSGRPSVVSQMVEGVSDISLDKLQCGFGSGVKICVHRISDGFFFSPAAGGHRWVQEETARVTDVFDSGQ